MGQRARADNLTVIVKSKWTCFSCVCPVIDNELRHNIVKVVYGSTLAIASWIHSYFGNVMSKVTINNKTDAWKTDVNLLNSTRLEITIALFYVAAKTPWRGQQCRNIGWVTPPLSVILTITFTFSVKDATQSLQNFSFHTIHTSWRRDSNSQGTSPAERVHF